MNIDRNIISKVYSAPYEGKGFRFWFKWCARHYPEMLGACITACIAPVFVYLEYLKTKNPLYDDVLRQRFKKRYLVLRHDDPRVKNLIISDKPY